VTRDGRLNRAAAALGTSVPTLHRRLAALEALLGAPLFVRANTGHRLTEAGERLVAAATAADTAVGGFRREAANIRSVPEGRLRIAAPDTIVQDLLAPRIGALRALAPLVTPEFITSPLRLRLDERQADMAVRLSEPGEASLVARRIGTVRFGLYAPAGSGLAAATLQPDGRLAVPWVGWGHALEHLPTARSSIGLLHAADKRAGANAMAQQIVLARALDAAMVLPVYLARRQPDFLRIAAAAFPLLELPIWLVANPETHASPAAGAVAAWIETCLAELR
jgi:DNA-binding transcriptional LysR family regulator